MWDHLPTRNMIDLQRAAAWKAMGLHARELLLQGYAYEADRVLDEMVARRTAWEAERNAP